MSKNPRQAILLLLPAIFAMGCSIWLLSISSDIKNSFLFGLSANRIGLLLLFIIIFIGFALATWQVYRSPQSKVHTLLEALENFPRIGLLAFSLILIAGTFLINIPPIYLREYEAIYQRLLPFIFWVTLTSLTFIINLLIVCAQKDAQPYRDTIKNLSPVFFATLSFFIGIWLLISATNLGISGRQDFWSKPGTPILWGQIIFILFICTLIDKILPHKTRAEIIFIFLLSFSAVVIWYSQEHLPGTFNTPPVAPFFETYPNSDSEIYDSSAQRLRTGQGMDRYVIDKPWYIATIALLHSFDNGRYDTYFLLQVIFFTLIPITGYWLGKELHSRHLGIAFSILLVIKEHNAITVTDYLSVSTSKMILSEPLTTLILLLFGLTLAKWLQNPGLDNPMLWTTGGLLGLASLVRLNSVTVIAPVFLLIGLAFRFRPKPWFYAILIFSFFSAITITPWVVRNAIVTENPISFILAKTEGVILENRYQPILGDMETTNTYITTSLENYSTLAGKWLTHYLRNLYGITVTIPPTLAQYTLIDMTRLPYWQYEWNGELTAAQILLLFSTLTISALGISATVKRIGVAGFVPLSVALGYNISTALALTSGGRYLLPIEWVLIFYYLLGWVHIFEMLGYRKSPRPIATNHLENKARSTQIGLYLCIFLALGSFPVAMEFMTTNQYPPVQDIREIPWQGEIPSIVLANENVSTTEIIYGMVLYPRFFEANSGLFENPAKPLIHIFPYKRLSFMLAGEKSNYIILPLKENIPSNFSHNADAWVIGCKRDIMPDVSYIEAIAVVFRSPDGIHQITSSDPAGCENLNSP